MDGNVTFGGLLEIDLASGTSADRLIVTGPLGFSSGYHINFNLGFTLTDSAYDFGFLQVGGGVTGFDPVAYSILGSYAGYSAQLENVCGLAGCAVDLRLTRIDQGHVPEPGALNLLWASCLALVWAHRRRDRSLARG